MPFQPHKVKQARGDSTQDWLAMEIRKIAGGKVSAATVSAWERGLSIPYGKNFDALCHVTQKNPNFFYNSKVGGRATRLLGNKKREDAA